METNDKTMKIGCISGINKTMCHISTFVLLCKKRQWESFETLRT